MLTTVQQHIRQLSVNQWGIKDSNLIFVLTNVYQDFQGITSNNVIHSNEAAKCMFEVCQALINNGIYKNFGSNGIDDHEFFLLFKNTLQFIFDKANSLDTSVSEREWKIYKIICSLLRELAPKENDTNLNKIIENVFFNEKFITTFKQCIEKASINASTTRCELLQDTLHHFYIDSQCVRERIQSQLLYSLPQCVASNFYLQSFDDQKNPSSKFFLEVCPSYILSYYDNNIVEVVNLLCKPLLNYLNSIISRKSSNDVIRYWRMLNVCATTEAGRAHFTECILEKLFDALHSLIKANTAKIPDPGDETKTIVVPTIDVKEKSLAATILTLLFNLALSSLILSMMRRLRVKLIVKLPLNKKEPEDVDKLALLCDMAETDIRFPAQNLIALILENIDRLPDPQKITQSYILYFTKTINGSSQTHNGFPLTSLIINMKSIAQNRQVKEQLVTQKGLPLLTKAACHEKFDVETIQQPALDLIWTVSFNRKAAQLWKSDKKFVTRLKSLLNSHVTDLKIVADGILWQLENEAQFRTRKLEEAGCSTNVEEDEKDAEPNYSSYYVRVETNGLSCVRIRKNLTDEERQQIEDKRIEEGKKERKNGSPYRHDLMISYCSENKALCHLIHECLVKTNKYNVWIDKEEMYGSLMERMAEAIEESEFVVICMSNDYMKSQACQSEAEYAYRRKRRLIFIKVETKYIPNSWLGLLVGNNYYTDFTKADFASQFKDLFTQIHRHRKIQDIDYTILDPIMTPSLIENAAAIIKKVGEKRATTAPTKPISNNVSTSSTSTVVPDKQSFETKSFNSNLNSSCSSTENKSSQLLPTRLDVSVTGSDKLPSRSTSPFPPQTSVMKPQDISIKNDDNLTEKNSKDTASVLTMNNIDRPDIRDEDFDSPTEPLNANIDITDLYPDDFDDNCDSTDSSDDDFNLYKNNRSSSISKTSRPCSRYSWSSFSTDSSSHELQNNLQNETVTDSGNKSILDQSKKQQVLTNIPKEHPSRSRSSSAISSTVCWYEKKPIDEWTQQEVFKFLNEKKLSAILTLFENDTVVNGKRLHELYSIIMPKSEEDLEVLKRKITSLPKTKISAVDYKRFQQELEKLMPPASNNESVICNIM